MMNTLDATAERSGAVGMIVLSVRMMLMMIPMKPVMMTMTMKTISPLGEGIPPTDFSLPESFFSLSGFHPRGGGGIFLRSVPLDF